MSRNNCYACLMPFSNDVNYQEEAKYCSNCSDKNGNFIFEGNVQEFKKICYQQMRANGMGFVKAKLFTFLIGFAP